MRQPVAEENSRSTAASDKVPLSGKAAYASGGLANSIMANAVQNFGALAWNIGFGIDPASVGLLLSLPRLWDAVCLPVMGYASDRTATRWGRRKPFMLAGGLGGALAYAAMWQPGPHWGPRGCFLWFLLLSLLYFTAYAAYSVSFQALGYALTPDYHERNRLMAFNSFVVGIGGIGMVWMFPLACQDFFGGIVRGTSVVSRGVAALMVVFVGICVVCVRERPEAGAGPPSRTAMRDGLFAQLRRAFSNQPFRCVATATLFMCMGVFSVAAIPNYLIIYYLEAGAVSHGAALGGVASTVWMAAGVLSVPLIAALANRIGKKRSLLLFLGVAAVAGVLDLVCFQPRHPYWALLPPLLLGPAFCALWMLNPSMMADVCDLDRLESGQSRQGLYGSIYSWMNNLGCTLAFGMSGVLLNLTGFDVARGALQAGGTFFKMQATAGLLTFGCSVAAMACISRYPISEKMAYDIKARLEKTASPS